MCEPGLEEIIARAKADGTQPEAIALQCLEVTRKQRAANAMKQALARDAAGANITAGDAPPNPVPVDPKKQAQQRATNLVVNAMREARPSGLAARAIQN
jgi:hypothetical protein